MKSYLTKVLLLFCMCCLMGQVGNAQEAIGDTTIYKVVEQAPRFPGCEELEGDDKEKKKCADKQMLAFIYQNIVYPIVARENGNEGNVVVKFVVEKDGSVSNPEIMRNVEGGCGEEAIRVINLMNTVGVVWKPGISKGDTVRSEFIVPIKFKLEEAPDYTFVDGDSVYINFDTPVEFIGGNKAFSTFLDENLSYPAIGNDSCMIGVMDMEALVQPDNVVKVHNIIDYNGLGIDFQFEAINILTTSMGKWKPAELNGRKVPAVFPVRMIFKPEVGACQQALDNFEKAEKLVAEGAALVEQENNEEGIAKISEAIELFPKNADYLYTRGMIYMNDNVMDKACEDLTRAKETLLVTWFDNLIPIICAQAKLKTTE